MTESYRFVDESSPPEVGFEEAEAGTRSQKRALRTRRKLLTAALNLFAERGIETTTIEDITEQADLGKGTFYRHFSNKEELSETLLDSILAKLIHLLQGGKKPLASQKEALERIFEVHARFYTKQTRSTLLLFDWQIKMRLRDGEPEGLGPRYEEYLAAVSEPLQPFMAEQTTPEARRALAAGVSGLLPGFFSIAWLGLPPEAWSRHLAPLRRAFVAGAISWLSDKVLNPKVVAKPTELSSLRSGE